MLDSIAAILLIAWLGRNAVTSLQQVGFKVIAVIQYEHYAVNANTGPRFATYLSVRFIPLFMAFMFGWHVTALVLSVWTLIDGVTVALGQHNYEKWSALVCRNQGRVKF